MRLALASLTLLMLASCSRPTAEMETVSERFAPITREFKRVTCENQKKNSTDPAVRARDCRYHPPVNPNLRKTPLYCYRTLGEPDCYVEPLQDADMRLIGVLLPEATVIQPVATREEATTVVQTYAIQSSDLPPPSATGTLPNPAPSGGPRQLLPR